MKIDSRKPDHFPEFILSYSRHSFQTNFGMLMIIPRVDPRSKFELNLCLPSPVEEPQAGKA
ncbi:hypothetical protein WJ13_18440 [Burkholderia seminalis]|nr:hypothetical protein WJ13_18440 [Burkholderia seminalis]